MGLCISWCLDTFFVPCHENSDLRPLEIKNEIKLVSILIIWNVILVPRGRARFGQHQESRPLARSNIGSPRFTDFPFFCAWSESSVTNLIGSGLNLLCFQSHSNPECRWTWPEVAILGVDQKERGPWGQEWFSYITTHNTTSIYSLAYLRKYMFFFIYSPT